MDIGIEKITFSTSKYFIKLETLARHRNVNYEKYYLGIGQEQMAIFPPAEDIVTLSFGAARKILDDSSKDEIDLLIFASESTFDLSKSLGLYLHKFLNLKDTCRTFDVKQACYSVTAALQLAKTYVESNKNSKVLIVGTDILKYQPGTTGEPTQGGAAVAMLISKDPKILKIEPYSGVHTYEIMDFWRPVNKNEAYFDGKLSAYNYLKSLTECLKKYYKNSHLLPNDIDDVCFHAPFSKMAIKAARQEFQDHDISHSLVYNKIIGNSCSASVYICLISLLDNAKADLAGKRMGIFSYGSGSVAEFFSCVVSNEYKKFLKTTEHKKLLKNRIELPFSEYEAICYGQTATNKKYLTQSPLFLKTIESGKHLYGSDPAEMTHSHSPTTVFRSN